MIDEIFKAYDVRGKAGSELTPDIAEKIGVVFAQWLPNEGKIAIGRDMRKDSKDLSDALIRGMTSVGRSVVDLGLITTDMLYFAVGKYGYAGGLIVTASHNPGEYNGIKFCREEAKPVGIESGLSEIRDATKTAHLGTASLQNVEQIDATSDWLEHVLSFVDKNYLTYCKLAVDAGNGMAGSILTKLIEHVPWRIVPMYFELDGSFPHHPANPMDPANLRDLQLMIEKEQCQLGIAFDGDGDRAVLVDEKGQIVSGTVLTAMLAEYTLKLHPNATILCNAICGRAVDEAVKKNGGKLIRTKVGHSYIKEAMRKENAAFAGEHSGHYYFKDNWCADSGLIAAVIAVTIVIASGKPLSEIAEQYRQYVAIPESNFEVPNDQKQPLMEKIAAAFPDGHVDWLDGLTVNFQDSWFNVRPSNTEPYLRLNAEAVHGTRLNDMVAKVSGIISPQEDE